MRLILLSGVALLVSAASSFATPAGVPGARVPSLFQAANSGSTTVGQGRPSSVFALPKMSAPPSAVPRSSGMHPAVVRVVAPGDGSVSYGSGTLVDVKGDYGLVVTNWHVINEATENISVVFPDGFYSLATVRKVDREWDLAALVIKRPNVTPVPVANAPSQPGELLTIIGYGSGKYRAATGRCTTYVAPGMRMPYEMVELAASARQGDSGGPILNQRGELAGVLFGEGGGRTAGSYCGRVKWFLASLTDRPTPPLKTPDVIVNREPETPPLVDLPRSNRDDQYADRASPITSGFASRINTPAPTAPSPTPQTTFLNSAQTSPPSTEAVTWSELAGSTVTDQAKTFLAILGCCAILLHTLRLAGSE
jgi:hypothetical protein